MRILVAENDPPTLDVLQSTLSQWGYDVIACADGAQAWDVLRQADPPRLAILEWSLPGMDGPEICRKVREVQNFPYVYIILLTDQLGKPEMLTGMEAGADDHIVKPLDARELQVRVGAGSRIVGLQDSFMYVLKLSEFEAAHDPLTGLWNRAAIMELLRKELARSKRDHTPVGIIAAGLDQFKHIQERYGSLTSDAILREIVLRIHSTVRTYDSVGRTGDEDFLIIAPGCDAVDSRALVARLCKSVSGYRATVGEEIMQLSMSAGVVSADGTLELDPQFLVTAAEDALMKAKAKGPASVELV
jgi:two-component system, cell cycle response regulator